MLKRIKNFIKHDPALESEIKEEFFRKNIVPQLREFWKDEELARITGIDDLFSKDAKLTKELSHEELVEAYRRASYMHDKFLHVIFNMKGALNDYYNNHPELVQAFIKYSKSHKSSFLFQYQKDSYLIDVLKPLYNTEPSEKEIAHCEKRILEASDSELYRGVNQMIQSLSRSAENLMASSLLTNIFPILLTHQRMDLNRRTVEFLSKHK